MAVADAQDGNLKLQGHTDNTSDMTTTIPSPTTATTRSSFRQRLSMLVLWAFLLSPLAIQPVVLAGRGWLDQLFLFNAGTSLLWIGLAHFVTRRPFVMHLMLMPLYLTTAVDLFLLGTFGARLSSGYVTIILTDHAEAGEFFSVYAWPVALATLALVLVYVPALYGIRDIRKGRSVRLTAFALCSLTLIYGASIWNGVSKGTEFERAALDLAGHENSAPMGVVFQSALALRLHASTSALRSQRKDFTFGATATRPGDAEVYVWVVGESSRPSNWSMFGYARDTNPRLRATNGIIAFPNMLTTAPHTSVAVPSMLSLQPITDWPSIVSQQSIIGAFNETGFKTHWLSAQDADSWSGIIPQVASEAKRRRYFDRGFDGSLLDEFRSVLKDAPLGSKMFIVLHTKGSHFNYERRYPTEFGRFTTASGSRRDQIVGAYDNSVLYTDWLLGEIISTLASRGVPAALFFASDHGENLLDDGNQLLGHAIGNRYDLPTAAFAWLSDPMRRDWPEQARNIERNATGPLSLTNLSHSMLDLAGIHAKGFDPQMSLAHADFAVRARSYIVRGELRHEDAALTADRPSLAPSAPVVTVRSIH